jgi:hypothetical protein
MSKYIHFVGDSNEEQGFEKIIFPESSLVGIDIPDKAKKFLIEKGITYRENKDFSIWVNDYPLLDLTQGSKENIEAYKEFYSIGHCSWGTLCLHISGQVYAVPFGGFEKRKLISSDVQIFSKLLEKYISINEGKDLGILNWSRAECKEFEAVLKKVDPDIFKQSLWRTLIKDQIEKIKKRAKMRADIEKNFEERKNVQQKERERKDQSKFEKEKEELVSMMVRWVDRLESINKLRTEGDYNVLFKLPKSLSELKTDLEKDHTYDKKDEFFDLYLKAFEELCDSIHKHVVQKGTSISDSLSCLADMMAMLDLGFEILSDVVLPYMRKEQMKKYAHLLKKYKEVYAEIKYKRDAIFGYTNPFTILEL